MELKIVQMNGRLHASIFVDYSKFTITIYNNRDKGFTVHFANLIELDLSVQMLNIYKILFHAGYHKHEICKILGMSSMINLTKIIQFVHPKKAKTLIRQYFGKESRGILAEIG